MTHSSRWPIFHQQVRTVEEGMTALRLAVAGCSEKERKDFLKQTLACCVAIQAEGGDQTIWPFLIKIGISLE